MAHINQDRDSNAFEELETKFDMRPHLTKMSLAKRNSLKQKPQTLQIESPFNKQWLSYINILWLGMKSWKHVTMYKHVIHIVRRIVLVCQLLVLQERMSGF